MDIPIFKPYNPYPDIGGYTVVRFIGRYWLCRVLEIALGTNEYHIRVELVSPKPKIPYTPWITRYLT